MYTHTPPMPRPDPGRPTDPRPSARAPGRENARARCAPRGAAPPAAQRSPAIVPPPRDQLRARRQRRPASRGMFRVFRRGGLGLPRPPPQVPSVPLPRPSRAPSRGSRPRGRPRARGLASLVAPPLRGLAAPSERSHWKYLISKILKDTLGGGRRLSRHPTAVCAADRRSRPPGPSRSMPSISPGAIDRCAQPRAVGRRAADTDVEMVRCWQGASSGGEHRQGAILPRADGGSHQGARRARGREGARARRRGP